MIFYIIFTLLLIKVFLDETKVKCKSKNRLEGKVVLITGGDTGIGKATTIDLSKRGAKIIIACQYERMAIPIRDEIIAETGNPNIIVKELDLASFKSIKKFAKEIYETEDKIDILINNAGTAFCTKFSDDNIFKIVQINLVGAFFLTKLLMDLINKSETGRIIFVGSLLAIFSYGNSFKNMSDNGELKLKYFGSPYNMIDYGKILISNELARKLRDSNITVNVVHPGLVDTAMLSNSPSSFFTLLSLFKTFLRTPEEGAQSIIYAAVSPKMKYKTGKFVIDCKPYNFFKSQFNIEDGKILWAKCEKMLKLD